MIIEIVTKSVFLTYFELGIFRIFLDETFYRELKVGMIKLMWRYFCWKSIYLLFCLRKLKSGEKIIEKNPLGLWSI